MKHFAFILVAIAISGATFGQNVHKAAKRMSKKEGISYQVADTLLGITLAYKSLDLSTEKGKQAAKALQSSSFWERAKDHRAHYYLNHYGKGFLQKYPISMWFRLAPPAGTPVSESRMVCTKKGGCTIMQVGNHQ